MNKGALALYLQACRHALESNLRDPSSWMGGLDTSLLHLRQALTCSVCGRLLDTPMGPPESVCQHYVCRGCIGGKTRFTKRTCGWCKEHTTFVPNPQIQSLVPCLRHLCQYLNSYLSPETSAVATTNPTEFIIREVAVEIGADTSPMNTDFKSSNRPTSPLFVLTSQPDFDSSLDITNISNDFITIDPKDEDRSSLRKRKRKIDNLVKVEDFGPSTSLSSPNRSSQLRSSGFSPQSPRLSTQSSPCYAAVVTDRSFETGELPEVENGDRTYFGDNVVLSEHDYNKNLLSTPPNTISGSSRSSGAATLPSRGRFANRSDAQCRRNKRNNTSVLEVGERTSTKFIENGPVVKKMKSATIRQIVEANSYLVSDGSLSNEDDRTMSSPTNHSEGRVRLSKMKNTGRTGCRCAMTKPNPGKLTCYGQRCPCYSAFKGCVDCKCRGCRNPRGDPRRVVPVQGGQYGVGEIVKRSPTVGGVDLVGRVTLT